MYILETEQSFDSAHFLSGYEGKCSNLHGHRWRVVARIAMDELIKEGQTRDMVIDFGDFKNALKKLTDALDHSFIFETGSLKERTVAALKDEGFLLHEVPFRPTAEQFSRYFYEQLQNICYFLIIYVFIQYTFYSPFKSRGSPFTIFWRRDSVIYIYNFSFCIN